MVSKCANPACQAPFRYLHEGRLFNVFDAVPGAGQRPTHASRMELYWLCNQCVKTVRIVLQEGRIETRPLKTVEHDIASNFSFEEADAMVEFS
jgi:hypothetical protein